MRNPDDQRRRFLRGILAGAFLAWFPSLGPAEARTVTFEEAVAIALRQSSSVQRAENAAVLGRSAASEASMQFFPDLRLNVSGSENWGRVFSETEGRLLTQTNESLNARLSSSVVLFDGFSNVANVREARLGRSAAMLDLDRARQTVVFSVISAYLALIEAREQVKIAAENLDAQKDQERVVRALVDGGTRPISDLYQQQATTAGADLTLVEARRTAALQEIELTQMLQLDPTAEYEFEIPSIPEETDERGEAELPALLAQAFERRADFRAVETRVEAAEQAERSAGGGYWPTLTLSAGYGSGYSSSAGRVSFADQLDERQSGNVSLGLSYPVFDRFSTGRSRERARVAVSNARLELADLRQTVALEVKRAVLDRDAARERLRAAVAQVAAAERALEAVQHRYEVGGSTLHEVTLARADLVSANSARASARYRLLWQRHVLDYYVGDLDPEADLIP